MFIHGEEAYLSLMCRWPNAYKGDWNVVSYGVEMGINDLHSLHGKPGSIAFQQDAIVPNS